MTKCVMADRAGGYPITALEYGMGSGRDAHVET